MRQLRILVVPVLYRSPHSGVQFVDRLLKSAAGGEIHVVLVDNSPICDPALPPIVQAHRNVRLRHFPDNPGYMGAAKRVLAELISTDGPLDYTAVVLCNTDLEIDGQDLVRTVERMAAQDRSCQWVLAPKLVNSDGRQLNPHMLSPPSRIRSITQRSLGFSYPSAVVYRLLVRARARARRSVHVDAAADSRMFAPHGSVMIFGCGYFRSGGTFPDGPLFNEESAVGQLAALTGTPVVFTPDLVARHEGQLTTGAPLSRQRYLLSRDAWRFYRHWRPAYASGTMRTWFKDPES